MNNKSIWIDEAQNRIYTIVRTRSMSALKTSYPDIRFTMDDGSSTETKFPTVYIHYLPFAEFGENLECDGINGVMCGVQIDVTVSKEQGRTVANKVIYEVIDQFSKLGFRLVLSPEFQSTGNETKFCLSRMRRNICWDDKI